MSLQSLVFCSDEKILRVLRRVLSDLEIMVEHCPEADAAVHQLTRRRFEAVIVDCADELVATQVLKSARSAPSNKRAVAVAIIDTDKAVSSAFDLGAHFVLYKPISMERAKTSFRAARALMKRERRRNQRVPISIPVSLASADGGREQTVTTDLGEGGMAIQACRGRRNSSEDLRVQFTLPDSNYSVECFGEVAWENAGRGAGIRFLEVPLGARDQLKLWLSRQCPEIETDDPPLACRLTDLSPCGCYLETGTPLPVRAKVVLHLDTPEGQVQADGTVRIMHADTGMGVEFRQGSEEHSEVIAKFIQAVSNAGGRSLEVGVEADGLENGELETAEQWAARGVYDPLVDIFFRGTGLKLEAFRAELYRNRGFGAKIGAKRSAAFSV